MKITGTLFLVFFYSLSISAQKKFLPEHESFIFYNVAYVAFAAAPAGTELGWWSVSNDLGVMFESSWSEKGGIGYGLSYSFQNFSNNHLVSTNLNTGAGLYQLASDTSFEVSRQSYQYVYLPLELRFRSKKNEKGKFYRFYLGARGGVRTIGRSSIRRANSHVRFYQLDDVSRFRADAYLKIGYGNTSFYAFYALTPLYDKGDILSEDGSSLSSLQNIRPMGIGLSFMY